MKHQVFKVIFPIATTFFLLIAATKANARPDLTFTSTDLSVSSTTITAGESITVGKVTVKNGGTKSSGAFLIGIYLSSDTVIEPADMLIKSASVPAPGLASGQKDTRTVGSVQIPTDTQPGKYYIGILLDRSNAVLESSEINNYISSITTIEILHSDFKIINAYAEPNGSISPCANFAKAVVRSTCGFMKNPQR